MSILDVPGISKAQLEARVTGITDEVVEARDMAQAFAIDSLGAVIESHAIVLQAPLDAADIAKEQTTKLQQDLNDPAKGANWIMSKHNKLASSVQRTVNDKLSDHINFFDRCSPEQRIDIESRLGTLDCSDVWDALLLELKNPGPFVYPVTPKIEFPIGVIYFATPKPWQQRIHIVGQSTGQNGGDWATTIKFAVGSAGFIPIKANTGPLTPGADGSIFQGLYIEGGGQNSGARTLHGIDMQARITVRDCTIINFPGNNINIVADTSARKNANLWILDNVRLSAGGMHGLYVQGGDTNAGIATMVNASSNNRSGIYDASFLGNTYIACHTASNGKQGQVHYEGNRYYCASDTLGGGTVPGTDSSVWVLIGTGTVHPVYPTWVSGGEYYTGFCYRSTNANARNVFIGCYSEGAQPPARIMSPAVVVGGIITGGGAGMSDDSTGLIIAGGGRISDFTNTSHGSEYYFAFGRKSVKGAFGLFAAVDHVKGLTLQWDAASGAWVWKWANSQQLWYMTTAGANISDGRSVPVGGGVLGIPNPILLGAGSTVRRFGRANWTSGSSFPTSGPYAKGEIYFIAATAAGGKAGIACTTTGDAGVTAVFKLWGAIDA